MSSAWERCKRGALVAVLAVTAIAGTANLLVRRDLPVELAHTSRGVEIASIRTRAPGQPPGLQPGDLLLAIRDRAVPNLAVARWEMVRVQPGEMVSLRIQRGDSVFDTVLRAGETFPLGYLILDRLSGLAFIVLGLGVWWLGHRDSTVRAFMRINVLTGASVMLFTHENIYPVPVLNMAYGLAWLATYCLLPCALADFLFRFPQSLPALRFHRARQWLLYSPCAVLFAVVATAYLAAAITDQPTWIARYDTAFLYGLGPMLLLYVLASVARLVRVYLRPPSAWEKNQIRWLLLCLIIGLMPFMLLNKLPVALGLMPLVSTAGASGFLVIAPVGWGMAVASFRMFKVEWTLSRTMVYAITIGIVVYALAALAVAGAGYLNRGDLASLVVLVIIAAMLLGLASLSLADRVRWAVDRLYYGDWFNDQKAVESLSDKLANCFLESDIVRILTEELPSLLKIEKCTLLFRDLGGGWSVPLQTASLPHADAEAVGTPLLGSLDAKAGTARTLSAGDPLTACGYAVAVPLVHAEGNMGWLLLGRKVSGAPYGERDHHLLAALSGFAGMALANRELGRRIVDHERRAVAVDLAGRIAHEINNALSPLVGQAQLIEHRITRGEETLSAPEMAPPLKIMLDMCGRIKRIAQNLTRLSEPVKLEKRMVCLNDVAEDVLQILSETAGRIKRFRSDDPSAAFRLNREFEPNLPAVLADAQQLGQVFMNLVLNAADAIEEIGTGTLTIGTRLAVEGDGVIGFVDDTGPGIPHELADRIFQPYFTTKPKGKGSGLGLAIVRSIVEAHHGHVYLVSRAGSGARIEFFLPILSPTGASR